MFKTQHIDYKYNYKYFIFVTCSRPSNPNPNSEVQCLLRVRTIVSVKKHLGTDNAYMEELDILHSRRFAALRRTGSTQSVLGLRSYF
jgi:hypothetical protein